MVKNYVHLMPEGMFLFCYISVLRAGAKLLAALGLEIKQDSYLPLKKTRCALSKS